MHALCGQNNIHTCHTMFTPQKLFTHSYLEREVEHVALKHIVLILPVRDRGRVAYKGNACTRGRLVKLD